jgi:hypothetical protein
MKSQTKLTDHFAKVNENYNVTNCIDGFVVEVSGQDSNGTWVNGKFVFKTLDELKDTVQELVRIPRT